jgi:hypothetical protein
MIIYELNKPQQKLIEAVIKQESKDTNTLISEHTFQVLNRILETKKYTELQSELLNTLYTWYSLNKKK